MDFSRVSLQVLTFSGDITAELLDGDAITLDESSILLNGRPVCRCLGDRAAGGKMSKHYIDATHRYDLYRYYYIYIYTCVYLLFYNYMLYVYVCMYIYIYTHYKSTELQRRWTRGTSYQNCDTLIIYSVFLIGPQSDTRPFVISRSRRRCR